MTPIAPSSVYIKLTEYFFKFVHNDADYQIARTLIWKINDFPHIMIEEIAFLANTAPSSVTKFCKKLGYHSFKAMKTDLVAYAAPDFFSFKEQLTDTADPQELISLFLEQDSMIQTASFEQFDTAVFQRIATRLKRAKVIACISNTYAFPISNFLRELLAPLGIPVLAINRRSEPEALRQVIQTTDVVFYISLTGQTVADYQEALAQTTHASAYQVLMTRKPQSKSLTFFQEVISFDACEPFFETNYYSQRIMMNAILYLYFLLSAETLPNSSN